ncbi:hypothetical protein F5887DRAFT_587201 [Amanita rubescens]|nr:hypothetical protein F5887DRAFT_587201 [Amanita rubescens]
MENQPPPRSFLILRFGDNTPVATSPASTLADIERVARQFFPIPASARSLKLYTKFENDELIRIDPVAWPDIYHAVTTLWIELDSPVPTVIAAPRVLRKPVIYLYPPTPISVNVRLALTSTWKFSAIYPLVPVKRAESNSSLPIEGETIAWNVFAEPNGTLRSSDGLKVSYLYWEADAQACQDIVTPPMSRSHTPVETFDPSNPVLTPHNSVLLRVPSDLTKYLDKALLALGLHTEARTSFITFWLPLFVKYEYVALRFLEQSSYESAARLDITPKPDIVTRVFMLFRGVGPHDLALWTEAEERVKTMDVDAWRSIVGVNAEGMGCDELFRVLEWGGMEVR